MEAVCDICMFSPKCKDERLSCDHSAEFCSTCIDECVSHGIYVCPICRAAMDVPIPVRVEIGDIEINTSSRITSRAKMYEKLGSSTTTIKGNSKNYPTRIKMTKID